MANKKTKAPVVEQVYNSDRSSLLMTVVNGEICANVILNIDVGPKGFIPGMDGVSVEAYIESIKKQVTDIQGEHFMAHSFTVSTSIDDYRSESTAQCLHYLRPMLVKEQTRYDDWKKDKRVQAKHIKERKDEEERAMALKLAKKFPELLSVNKKATATGRVSSTVKAVSNSPKRAVPRVKADPYLKGIMERSNG